MVAIRKILVPTDFSETAAAALDHAMTLARALGASLHVLHVLHDPVAQVPNLEAHASLPDLREELERDARQSLTAAIPEPDRKAFNAVVTTAWGHPADEVIDYVRKNDIDLVVMGTHGRGAITRMVLGSVADKVIRQAHCPVLTVSSPQHR